MKAAITAGTLMKRRNWSNESIVVIPLEGKAPRPWRYSAAAATCCSTVRSWSEMAAPLIASNARIEIMATIFMAGTSNADRGQKRQISGFFPTGNYGVSQRNDPKTGAIAPSRRLHADRWLA